MLKTLPMETLRKMTVDEQDKLIKEAVALESKAKKATDAHTLSFPAAGKLVCIAEERLNELKSTVNVDGSPRKPLIAVNTSLATYWGSLTKTSNGPGKLNNHWYSCAVTFGTYVRTELVSEEDYDKCPAQWLEIAASISTEAGGDVTSDAVVEAADVLKDRPKDAGKQLRNILATLKTPKALSSDKAKEMLAAILAAGHMTTVVIPMIGAEIAHIEDSEVGRNAYHAMYGAVCMFEQNVDSNGKRRFADETIGAWMDAYQKPSNSTEETDGTETPASHVTVITAENSAAPVAAA